MGSGILGGSGFAHLADEMVWDASLHVYGIELMVSISYVSGESHVVISNFEKKEKLDISAGYKRIPGSYDRVKDTVGPFGVWIGTGAYP